jgi:phospholipase C
VLITFDEGRGYWPRASSNQSTFSAMDPRIPLLILSPYSTGDKIDRNDTDHVSILKFIERTWKLDPLTKRSRDKLPPRQPRKTILTRRPTCSRTCSTL